MDIRPDERMQKPRPLLRKILTPTLLILLYTCPLPAQTKNTSPPDAPPGIKPAPTLGAIGTLPSFALAPSSSSAISIPNYLSRALAGSDAAGEVSKSEPTAPVIAVSKPGDYNSRIYYKNRLEFALDSGSLDQNVPFPFDYFIGCNYNTTPLQYTLVPIIASLRWQLDNVRGPWILRGNFDATFSGIFTPIPRGPETHFGGYAMGIRRNFVPHNFKIAPYFEFRAGTGGIDAKGPKGVDYAQGQDFVFTLLMGSGFRYNLTPRYSFSAGVEWMHISNLDMSEPKFSNYGINVYGPMFGIDVRLGHHGEHTTH